MLLCLKVSPKHLTHDKWRIRKYQEACRVACQANTHPSKPDDMNLPVVEVQDSHEPIEKFENIRGKKKNKQNKTVK